MKKNEIIVEIDEHHSSMGTSTVYNLGEKSSFGISLFDLGFQPKRGERYKVTVEKLPSNPSKRPRKNPFIRSR